MSLHYWGKNILIVLAAALMCNICFANENLYKTARAFQRDGKYDEAIATFRECLTQPIEEDNLTDEQIFFYTEALVQLMNTYQSKGEPEACLTTLREVFKASAVLQKQCLRDYYSVMGYALSRTENMDEAEETMIKALTLPLNRATPERYFRDYAYAAAVFYSNPNYQKEVINWCEEALTQAELCKNTSGKQWVMAMLGSLYKRSGQLNRALELFKQSKDEALARNDELGVLNSLHTLVDFFLYWNIPEYANLYASEAVKVELNMSKRNPMVSAQTYINKGRALHQLGKVDSVLFYADKARELCQSLPYNSGLVDVELLHGTIMTEKGGDCLHMGIQELLRVAQEATAVNRTKAYHQLAQTYIRHEKNDMADEVLDSLYALLCQNEGASYIHIDYESIINYYLKSKNQDKANLYVGMMLQEQQAFNESNLKFNLVETIADLHMDKEKQALKIIQLRQANHRLWLFICVVLSIIVISGIVTYLFYQKKQHKIQMEQADEKLSSLANRLNQLNDTKEMRAQEIRDFLKDKDNRQELETLTPSILKAEGEAKFRQYFELLYPLFLPRLRDKVPTITRREELLSMLIVLKQDNKKIAELLGVAPRSILMLRHRFRQKMGMTAEYSLENFIEAILSGYNSLNETSETNPETSNDIQE